MPAAARQRAASLSQEQYRSVTLEQNLVLTQNDLTRHAVDHEQHIDSLQSSLGILRDTVVQRERAVADWLFGFAPGDERSPDFPPRP